jgi:hypothetical protein
MPTGNSEGDKHFTRFMRQVTGDLVAMLVDVLVVLLFFNCSYLNGSLAS